MSKSEAVAAAAADAAEYVDEPGTGKVRVPASAGDEITFTTFGESRTFKVNDGMVSPANANERALLLLLVDGAKPADD